jgi:NAD(P)H-hydrate epimerase
MRILSVNEIQSAEQLYFKSTGTPTFELMQRAADTFAQKLTTIANPLHKIAVIAGTGNNGGDGVGVGLYMHQQGYKVEIYVTDTAGTPSADFKQYLQLAQAAGMVIRETDNFPADLKADIIVDALFGIGLKRPLDGRLGKLVEDLNKHTALKVALDMPSGLLADEHTPGHKVVQAQYTFSFQWPKLAFMMPENGKYVGHFEILDIGIGTYATELSSHQNYFTTLDDIKKIYKPRQKFSHKGTYGHALLVAGSLGKMGAAVLAARACLHSGVGLVTMHIPRCGYEIAQIAVPEAMCQIDEGKKHISSPITLGSCNAIGIGPGLGMEENTAKALAHLLGKNMKPAVIDADGLNLAAKYPGLHKRIPVQSILTPHPKEFERLAGKSANDFEVMERLRNYAKHHRWVVLIKGPHTCICTPDGTMHFNSTGNPGMATAGSGDVLTGIITSLVAQDYTPEESAIMGVYLHGLAGDLAKADHHEAYLTAGEIIKYLGKAFQMIHS